MVSSLGVMMRTADGISHRCILLAAIWLLASSFTRKASCWAGPMGMRLGVLKDVDASELVVISACLVLYVMHAARLLLHLLPSVKDSRGCLQLDRLTASVAQEVAVY